MHYSADYSTLLDLFIRLVQSQAGKRIESGEAWRNDAQTLSVKLFRHLVSIQTLATGATVEQNHVPTVFFVDHASVKVVARAALETYLVFFICTGTPTVHCPSSGTRLGTSAGWLIVSNFTRQPMNTAKS
ncbi:hypothetical protein LP414_13120 [Polaromonas sp. P1(28)-13]|nr:hypothetical protein LP414_13120 [Polaromonas sp. P1(28)-13]